MDKILNFIKKNYLWLIAILCMFITLYIVEDVFETEMMKSDVYAYQFFVKTIRSNNLTSYAKVITNLGSALPLLIICILSFIFIKNKRKPICMICNLGFVAILNQIFKFIIQRPRLEGYRLVTESGYSFPSGHSMVSVAFYGFIVYLIIKYVDNKKIKYLLSFLLCILTIEIGISRIYLGVHYASDVIAGALISIAYLIIFTRATKKFINKGEVKNEK